MSTYEIYSDASWEENKLKEFLFAACIIYKDGNIIYNKTKRLSRHPGVNPEFTAIKRSISIFADLFLKDTFSEDIIIFKSDSKPELYKFNIFFKAIKNNESIDTFKLNIGPPRFIKSSENFKNRNVEFLWIPREENSLADSLSKECRDNFLNELCAEDTFKYMKNDLEHTVRKWEKWFKDFESLERINNLKEFINLNFK